MTDERTGKDAEKIPEKPITELTDEDLGHVSGGTKSQEVGNKAKTAQKAADAIDAFIRG